MTPALEKIADYETAQRIWSELLVKWHEVDKDISIRPKWYSRQDFSIVSASEFFLLCGQKGFLKASTKS